MCKAAPHLVFASMIYLAYGFSAIFFCSGFVMMGTAHGFFCLRFDIPGVREWGEERGDSSQLFHSIQ
jgi:hypothetical protein